jgi:hypothetical protein
MNNRFCVCHSSSKDKTTDCLRLDYILHDFSLFLLKTKLPHAFGMKEKEKIIKNNLSSIFFFLFLIPFY